MACHCCVASARTGYRRPLRASRSVAGLCEAPWPAYAIRSSQGAPHVRRIRWAASRNRLVGIVGHAATDRSAPPATCPCAWVAQ